MDLLSMKLHKIAGEKFRKGEGTNPLSKILSLISLHLFVFIIACIFNEKMYIQTALFIVLGLTPLSVFVCIGFIVYFIIIKYWIGVILCLIYLIITQFATSYGVNTVKKNLISGKSNINPFEGAIEIKLIYIILPLFGFALITNGIISIILWVIYGLLTILLSLKILYRTREKWRQIHFPLMYRYSTFSGYEEGIREKEKREFEIKNPLVRLILSAYENMNYEEAVIIYKDAQDKLINFQDKLSLQRLLNEKFKNVITSKLEEMLAKTENLTKSENDYLSIRYVISEIVEKEFGSDERIEYLFAVFSGKAL